MPNTKTLKARITEHVDRILDSLEDRVGHIAFISALEDTREIWEKLGFQVYASPDRQRITIVKVTNDVSS